MDYTKMTTEELTLHCTKEYVEMDLKKKEYTKAQTELYKRMTENQLGEVKSPFGRFYSYIRTDYTMPEDITEMKKNLTLAEEQAKAEGRAMGTEKTFFKFAKLKKDEEI